MKECSSDRIAASMRRPLIGDAGSVHDCEFTVERETGCQTRTKLSAMSPSRASVLESRTTSPLTITSLAAAMVRSDEYVPLTQALPRELGVLSVLGLAAVPRYGLSG